MGYLKTNDITFEGEGMLFLEKNLVSPFYASEDLVEKGGGQQYWEASAGVSLLS